MLKIIVDCNVWISALIRGGIPKQVLLKVESGTFQLVSSEQLLFELITVLDRPKFANLVDKKAAHSLISLIASTALFVNLKKITPLSRDSKDDVYIEHRTTK